MPSIVVDCGSFSTKVGFSPNPTPLAVLPSLAAGEPGNFFPGKLGRDREDCRSFVSSGRVTDWDDFELFMHWATNSILRCDSRDFPLVLTEPPQVPFNYRAQLAETAFESFQVPSLFVGVQPVLALYSLNPHQTPTGVLVDLGEAAAHAVPVVDGYVVAGGVRKIAAAGQAVTRAVVDALMARQELRKLTASNMEIFELARQIKEKHCFVSDNPRLEFKRNWDGSQAFFRNFQVTDTHSVDIGYERFIAPELLFEPALSGLPGVSLPQAVIQAVAASPVDYRKRLLGSVALAGGTAALPGLSKRLQAELRGKPHRAVVSNVKVSKPYSTWVGAAVLAENLEFSTWLISKQKYAEEGNRLFELPAQLA